MLRIEVDSESGTISTEAKGTKLQLRTEAVAAISAIAESLHKITDESEEQIIDKLCSIAKQVSDIE